MSSNPVVAGVDGCRAGWLVVLRDREDPRAAKVGLLNSFGEILAMPEKPGLIAIDIPIGLPERVVVGGRRCDREARAKLGGRQSSVFAMPARAAVECLTYAEACAAALARSDPPRKVSKQAFNLFPKIREVDHLMTPELQDHIVEGHPEVAFWNLNGRKPLDLPKKVKSRANPDGLARRCELLVGVGYDPEFLAHRHLPASKAGPDDLIDAVVNSWTASEIAKGRGVRFPDLPERDGKGLRMEIWG